MRPEFDALLFLNTVLVLETEREPAELRRGLADIERALGRARSADPCAPRTLDIDVLYAGPLRREEAELTLPHPRWASRRFVVQPLADVRPGLHLPGAEGTVAERLAALPLKPAVRLLTREW